MFWSAFMLSFGVSAIQQPVAAKVLVDTSHRSLQHLADLARFEPAWFVGDVETNLLTACGEIRRIQLTCD
jgi:hypothetical protein